ncbi:MAG: hypothetical protein GTO14_02435 [Anaerolineales bacterium]|nr:hypothetical protein [Anaerolineales bacterium]
MTKKKRRLFESDRRMELKLRMAIKKMRELESVDVSKLALFAFPEQETIDRVIERVRKL